MNIYVSNLNFRTRGESLQTLFGEYGEVSSANIITDRETGRSRGFGFVEMPDESAARNAINALNGFELDERAINVNEARPKTERATGVKLWLQSGRRLRAQPVLIRIGRKERGRSVERPSPLFDKAVLFPVGDGGGGFRRNARWPSGRVDGRRSADRNFCRGVSFCRCRMPAKFLAGLSCRNRKLCLPFAPDNTGTRSSQCLVSYRTHFRRPSTYGAVISGVIIRKIFPIFIIIFPSY